MRAEARRVRPWLALLALLYAAVLFAGLLLNWIANLTRSILARLDVADYHHETL